MRALSAILLLLAVPLTQGAESTQASDEAAEESTPPPQPAVRVYRWVDADGDVHYSDTPLDGNAERTAYVSKRTDPAEVSARRDRQRTAVREAEIEDEFLGQREGRDAEWREEQERRCKLARDYFQKVNTQPRLYETTDDGGRRIYDTQERSQVVDDARERMRRECDVL